MTDDDYGSARMGQDSPAAGTRRRGPVIRTSDYVTGAPGQPPVADPAPSPGHEPVAAKTEPAPSGFEQVRIPASGGLPPAPPQRRSPVIPTSTPLPEISERLARLAPGAERRMPPNVQRRRPEDEPVERTPPVARRATAAAPHSTGPDERPLPEPAPPRTQAPRQAGVTGGEMAPPVAPIPAAAAPVAVAVEAAPPLVDAGMVAGSAWRHRRVVIGLMLGMAVLGGLASPFLPRKFTATTTLYFDPQQVKLNDGSSTPSLSQEAVLAIIDSQSQILVSRRVLAKVAKGMNLETDREFGGNAIATGAKLGKAVVVEREPNTYVVNLSVKSKDAEKSATIANSIVDAFLTEQRSAAEGAYDTVNTTLDGRLGALGEEVRRAEQAAADFKSANNIDDNAVAATPGATAARRSDQLETLLLAAQGKTIAAKTRYDAIAKFQVTDLASGSSPAEGTSNTLSQLQQQYAVAAGNVGNLETKLGSRHPQLLAARATLEGISGAIRQEVNRLITSARADYDRAQKEEDAIGKELALQKATDNTISGKLIEYRELQRKANAAREIYETVLKRTRQTGEEQRLLSSNVRVISAAEAPIQADGPSRTILMVGCILGGLVVGLMLGMIYAVIRLFAGRGRAEA